MIQAEGYKIFRDADKGKYTSDEFVDAEIILEKEVLLVTNHRLIYVIRSDLFGGWQSEWTYKWDEISSMRNVELGIEITIEGIKPKSSFSKMFSLSSMKKVLLIRSKKGRENLITLYGKHKN